MVEMHLASCCWAAPPGAPPGGLVCEWAFCRGLRRTVVMVLAGEEGTLALLPSSAVRGAFEGLDGVLGALSALLPAMPPILPDLSLRTTIVGLGLRVLGFRVLGFRV